MKTKENPKAASKFLIELKKGKTQAIAVTITDDEWTFSACALCFPISDHVMFTWEFSFRFSRGYWLRIPGHFRLWPPSWTDWHTWPRSHPSIDPMPDKMNSDYLKLFYREFQKYEVMTMSVTVVGGQPKKKKNPNPSYNATKHIERTFLISDYY